MSEDKNLVRLTAVEEFHNARLQAKLEQIKAALTGQSADLLSYEEVREKVNAVETNRRELKEIPLDAIVGSVGRYKDFTRRFLPLVEGDEHRWARVHTLSQSMEGLPPIEVFQIGDVYFVRDGNHRVSVAREQNFKRIEAYVTQVATAVPLEPDIQPDDLINKEQYAHFLERTRLDAAIPDLDLSMSAAGNYRVLEQQIGVHQQWVKERFGETISFEEAAVRWYEQVYQPVIQTIHERGMMRDFPNRTVTDLYVWIDEHRHELAEKLGWSVDAETAVSDLATSQSKDPKQVVQRLGHKLRDALTPVALEAGPQVGEWREAWLATHRPDRLFSHILVAIDGRAAGWLALQQALNVARREEGKIFGLHIVAHADESQSEAALAVQAEFEQRCLQADIPGEITIATGAVMDTICYRARWADLVVVSLSHPPGSQPVERLGSQFSQLLRRCPRPVLAVPRNSAVLDRALLAYDGSPKANEALFVAAYLAEQWRVSLTVVIALGKKVTRKMAEQVGSYLNGREVQAQFVVKKAPPAALILQTAQEQDCGLILMGGYGLNPLAEIVVGSTVDELLRSRGRPVLICR